MFTRPIIDSLDFARKGLSLDGEVPMAELPRMADILADQAGKISYTLRGLVGLDGRPQLLLELEGVCNLHCQRCLKALAYPVALVSNLKLVTEGELLGSDLVSDIEDDEADNIPAEKRLDVLDLLEEELLLSLPIAPKHKDAECQIAGEGAIRTTSPFALLLGLKK